MGRNRKMASSPPRGVGKNLDPSPPSFEQRPRSQTQSKMGGADEKTNLQPQTLHMRVSPRCPRGEPNAWRNEHTRALCRHAQGISFFISVQILLWGASYSFSHPSGPTHPHLQHGWRPPGRRVVVIDAEHGNPKVEQEGRAHKTVPSLVYTGSQRQTLFQDHVLLP